MHTGRFLRSFASIALFAAAGTLAGCSMGFDGEGVPLEELDLTGEAPTGVALLGPDKIIITEGAPFRVTAEGEGADKLRFSLDHGTLGISRETSTWNEWGGKPATVRVTMPAPRNLTLVGSGHMTTSALASEAEVSVTGSGTLEAPQIAASRLEVSITGSGDFVGGGQAESLTVSIAGSGDARMEKLKAGKAEVNIMGSGDVAFASDGEVEANIMGSGDVTVTGSARCKANKMGSGSVKCQGVAQPAE
ncbi:hypothetical protein ASD76_13460 [Altererythrobacter sp. Root672]|nr:hypothetical protein ASD76_13460 [Altererythrobacter sp. Root672]